MKRLHLIVLALLILGISGLPAILPPAVATAAQSSGEVPRFSHRLIVELEAPPLAALAADLRPAAPGTGRLALGAPEVAARAAAIEQSQRNFTAALQSAIPEAKVSTYRDELGRSRTQTYRITFNGMAIDPGPLGADNALAALKRLPGVKAVYRDRAHDPSLFASLPLIDAQAAWNNASIGGQTNAGAGVKIASMDGGVHHDAPMFNGAGYSYPPDFPPSGLGLTANNNGKIIASRAYFRTWDPPAAGDENAWPGENGTSHGVHTAGIAAGNPVNAEYAGFTADISGVAPAAWLMSYRVFYQSVTGDQSFYDAEGISALEDLVADGADVVNNSWGGGPVGIGREYDPLDLALINASKAGVFVAMSAGNSGPYNGTPDHPSSDYITVASTSTTANLQIGKFSVSAPEPVPDVLQNIAFGAAGFGGALPPPGSTQSYEFVPGERLVPANVLGCAAWPAGTFTGKAALIRRGTCNYSEKVYYAQQAGATFVIIYNPSTAGEDVSGMAAGAYADQVTIPSIHIGYLTGTGMITHYDTAHGAGAAAVCHYEGTAQNHGNTADVVAVSSSRGPGAGNVLKPDIAAPGVYILSQGFALNATGEARHLGFGVASGTSMAAPHVAGAAALLRQIHPDWPNAWIKSALMSTAQYLDVFIGGTIPAQPLDVGAGRLSLTNAADPGLILDPPSVGFGILLGTEASPISREVTVTNVGSQTETYSLSTLYTGDGFGDLKALTGFSVSPPSITLAPGASTDITVSCTPVTAGAYDRQGYVILQGSTHQAHFPVWARMRPPTVADVLLIDNDASATLGGVNFPNYSTYYTAALTALGYSYSLWDADAHFNNTTTIPDAATLASYRAVVYFTGNNWYPDGTYVQHTPLTATDMARLTDYANGGGKIIAMGQDVTWVLGNSFLATSVLGGYRWRDSVSGNAAPPHLFLPVPDGPWAFHTTALDLSGGKDGAGNQIYIDELAPTPNRQPDTPAYLYPYRPLLAYSGPGATGSNIVAMIHRDQPSLERPGVSYLGRSVFTSFGLEGVNDTTGTTTRSALLGALLNTCLDNPEASITVQPAVGDPNGFTFEALFASNIGGTGATAYRWDFGDGSGFSGPYTDKQAYHVYAQPGAYTVRVEITDAWGNRAVGTNAATTPSGSLQVTIGPTAVLATAAWRVDGGSWQPSGATVDNLAVGEHQVEFRPVSGYAPPPTRWVTVTDAGTATTTGVYLKLGGLKVTINPLAVRTLGARWRVDGGIWRKSGTTATGLVPGSHLVSCKTVRGWRKPADKSVSVPAGGVAKPSVTYTK